MIVRKLRIEKGLSQEQLAHMAGISTRTLQRIERGANASPETLKCIASALDTDFGDLRKDQNMPSGTHGFCPNSLKRSRKPWSTCGTSARSICT